MENKHRQVLGEESNSRSLLGFFTLAHGDPPHLKGMNLLGPLLSGNGCDRDQESESL